MYLYLLTCLFSSTGDWIPSLILARQMFYHLSYAPSLFFFSAVLGFELRAYTLSHSASPFFEIGSHYLPRLASNHDPLDLCLLSSWNYRREPLAPGSTIPFNLYFHVDCFYLFFFFKVNVNWVATSKEFHKKESFSPRVACDASQTFQWDRHGGGRRWFWWLWPYVSLDCVLVFNKHANKV
jgi:hypothetical protein